MFYLLQKINSQTSTRVGDGQLAQAQRVGNQILGPNCLSNILQSVLLHQHSFHPLPPNFRGFLQFLNLNLKPAFSTVGLKFSFLGFANRSLVTCLLFFTSPKLCSQSFLPCSIVIDSHLTKLLILMLRSGFRRNVFNPLNYIEAIRSSPCLER